MPTDSLILALGLALLMAGGEALVRGAAELARSLGVSPLIVGLTVVAFGTSAPELAVNLIAATQGNPGLSFGNIVGSNLANIGLIAGGAALLRPLQIHSTVLLRELPMMLVATLVALALASDVLLSSRPEGLLDRTDGFVLLLVFAFFVYYTLREGLAQRNHHLAQIEALGAGVPAAADVDDEEVGEDGVEAAVLPEHPAAPAIAGNVALTVAGAVLLVIGARFTVSGAVGLATSLGVSEVVIGLTVVAVGTSLPEFAASLVAARRNQADIAVGNIVGSNIFNLLLVGGLCSTVSPIPIPEGGLVDLWVTLGLSFLLWAVAATRGREIIRAEGLLLLGVYLVYVIQRAAVAWPP